VRLSIVMPPSLTLATKITLGRALLVPAFATSLAYRRPDWALFLFLLASLADAVDGHLARRRGEMTSFGALLDPIADKLLMMTAYILMGAMGGIPKWLAVLVVSRDVLLCLGCLTIFMTSGFVAPSPSRLGKATTALQMLAVLAALTAGAFRSGGGSALLALFVLTGAFTAVSGIHYLFFAGARMVAPREGGDKAPVRSR
jgi:cardiolipin synthase